MTPNKARSFKTSKLSGEIKTGAKQEKRCHTIEYYYMNAVQMARCICMIVQDDYFDKKDSADLVDRDFNFRVASRPDQSHSAHKLVALLCKSSATY